MADARYSRRVARAIRAGWLLLGLSCVGLGAIGAFIPLMPTTVFLILAAACFARSSTRLEGWLLSHPRFGPTLQAWRDHGAMSSGAKRSACAGMAIGYGLFCLAGQPGKEIAVLAAIILMGCAAFILTRPAAAPAIVELEKGEATSP